MRRLASMAYEATLLFGVVFIAGWLFDTLTQSRSALTLRPARQAWLFLVLGVYFVYFWRRGGQTLAMKTWRIKLICPGHERLPLARAIGRYLAAWMWLLPALGVAYSLRLTPPASAALLALGIALWALAALFDRDRQFLHDRLLGTRLVDVRPQTGSDS
jgi:uncharacterized RDD family membrane protein YckC